MTLEVWETDNLPPGGVCQPPDNPATTQCDDRLRYGSDWISGEIGEEVDESLGTFMHDEVTYEVFFTGLFDRDTMSTTPMTEFWSRENGIRSAFATVRIERVPEPAASTLAMLALAGLALAGRRVRRRA